MIKNSDMNNNNNDNKISNVLKLEKRKKEIEITNSRRHQNYKGFDFVEYSSASSDNGNFIFK
jgi:hypothetical protein